MGIKNDLLRKNSIFYGRKKNLKNPQRKCYAAKEIYYLLGFFVQLDFKKSSVYILTKLAV